jgi:UDP-N-acetylglucosamine--dolichyl-phosphate N-acetylglucosaminephosphotransferase
VTCERYSLITRIASPDGRLDPSIAEVDDPSKLTVICLQTLHALGLANVKFSAKNRRAQTTNLTLINLILTKTGPIKESTLTHWVIFIQVICSAIAFLVRYGFAGLLYDGDRR